MGSGGRLACQGPYTERHLPPFPPRFFLPVQMDLIERRREKPDFILGLSWSAVITKKGEHGGAAPLMGATTSISTERKVRWEEILCLVY
jgi:hypothetical protein